MSGTPPVLTDGVAVLRPLAEADIDDITRACQDPEIIAWTTVPHPYLREHAETFVRERTDDWWATPSWAICRHDGTWSGSIDLRPDELRMRAEVGYYIAPWARGQGLVTRALRLACAWAFTGMQLEAVQWRAVAGNEASRAAAVRVGFRVHDEPMRRSGMHRGALVDMWVGDLLPGEVIESGGAPRVFGLPALTRRETQVLELMARGMGNRQIATTLSISESTVKNHVRSILDKFNATSRVEAVVRAMRAGITRAQ